MKAWQKRLVALLVGVGIAAPVYAADVKVSALPDGGTIQTTDQIPVNRSGTTQRATLTSFVPATASALAANGTNCSSGQYARGVDASGNAENCTADADTFTGKAVPAGVVVGTTDTQTLTNKSISGGQVTSAVATATALAANGANCSAGSYPLGVDASGAVETCTAVAATANPTASVGLTAVNGSASTLMRSDAAPAIDVSITPTWTGNHTWSNAEPRFLMNESDRSTDLKLWDCDLNAGVLSCRTRTDADGAGVNWLAVTRGATTAISSIAFGNATNNPTGSWLGTGTFTFGGAATAGRFIVNAGTVPSVGIYGSSALGFATASTARGQFDAAGNFTHNFAMADKSYSRQVPTTGFTITIANNISTLLLVPAGTLATGTITMPATPIDGQEVRFTTSQIITALTVSPNSGQSIIAAPTTLAVGAGAEFIYSLSDTTWYRLY